jgi:hypothetical protein
MAVKFFWGLVVRKDRSQACSFPARGSCMPPFADAEVAEVAAYLRARYSSRVAWPKLTSAAAAARKQVVTPEMSMTGGSVRYSHDVHGSTDPDTALDRTMS